MEPVADRTRRKLSDAADGQPRRRDGTFGHGKQKAAPRPDLVPSDIAISGPGRGAAPGGAPDRSGPIQLAGSLARKGKEPTERQAQLEAQIKWLFASGSFDEFAEARLVRRRYSFANSMNIIHGYLTRGIIPGECRPQSQWEELGYALKDDAYGIPLFVPRTVEVQPDAADGGGDGGGEPAGTMTVFHMSDRTRTFNATEVVAPDGGEFAHLDYTGMPGHTGERDGAAEAAAAADLSDACAEAGINLRDMTDQEIAKHPADLYGWHDHKNNEIVVRPGLDDRRKATTVAHEMGHYFDKSLRSNPEAYHADRQVRDDCEFVAEAVAWSILGDYGIENPDSVSYIATFHSKTVKFARNVCKRWSEAERDVAAVLDQVRSARDKAA